MQIDHRSFQCKPVPPIELRPYQHAALDALYAYWRAGGGNPLVEMATGTGKSVVIGELARKLMAGTPRRILLLTHVRELIEQDAKALRSVWPDAPIGICSAGLGERDRDAPIVFAGIQSVYRDPEALGPRNLAIVDEAHLIPQGGDGMYVSTLARLRALYPAMRVAGFSATPYRLDCGRLDEGDGRLFDRIVYRYGIDQAIADGWLAPLVAKATSTEINVAGVHRRGGEFIAGELEHAADQDDAVDAAAAEIVERGKDRSAWLAFCCGVTHAEHVRDALRRRGISTETISGDTPGRKRGDIVARFHAGDIRCLTGCNVFTTGFDVPQIDLIAMLRPTLSTGLYVQMVGRGTRKAAGKINCTVLDFAGNVRRHGPVDAPAIQRAKPAGERHEGQGATGVAHVKVCPTCLTYVAPDITICPECGHQWSVRRRHATHARSADNLAILTNAPPVRLAVAQVALHEHRRPDGGRPTLRIEYRTAAGIPYLEWLTLEHSGPAQRVAAYKWRQLGGRPPVPLTVQAAIERKAEIADQSIEIVVRHNGRHWSVIERSAQRRHLLVSA